MIDFTVFEAHATENFSTALLVFGLGNSERFGEAFLRLIIDRLDEPRPQKLRLLKVTRNVRIELGTGTKVPDIFLDAEVGDARWFCLVEAKRGAAEGLGQLKNYREWLRTQAGARGLPVTLSRDH